MKKWYYIGTVIFLSTCLACSPEQKEQKKEMIEIEDIAAKINEIIITKAYVTERWENLTVSEKKRYKTKDGLLNMLIDSEIITELGIEKGYNLNSEINEKVKRYKRTLIKDYFIKNNIEANITDKQTSDYYNENKHLFIKKERIRVRHILADTLKEAETILKKIHKSGKNFQNIAKKYSKDSTASHGGDLGFFSKGRMVAEFEREAFLLKNPGDISKIVKTRLGYHIIQLVSRKKKSQLTQDAVKDDIKNKIVKAEKEKLINEFKANKSVTVKPF